MSVSEQAPQRPLQSRYETQPAAALRPIMTPQQKADELAVKSEAEAQELLALYVDKANKGHDNSVLHPELRYAQGYADAVKDVMAIYGGQR